MIRLTTNKGVIDIELNPEKAPVTCKNFEEYVTSKTLRTMPKAAFMTGRFFIALSRAL